VEDTPLIDPGPKISNQFSAERQTGKDLPLASPKRIQSRDSRKPIEMILAAAVGRLGVRQGVSKGVMGLEKNPRGEGLQSEFSVSGGYETKTVERKEWRG